MTAQEALRKSWMEAADDRLCGREQAKAWALREVWREDGKKPYGLNAFVASKVWKQKAGKPKGAHPTGEAISLFFQKTDSDPDWFPGKQSDEPRGPKRLLSGPTRTAIVSAAKRLKSEGHEPTYSAIVAACPAAVKNPKTGEPVDKKRVYDVFREFCYDDDPSDPWVHLSRLTRSALDDPAMQRRLAFATHMLASPHTASWYYTNLVWCDLCNSILPRTEKKAREMTLARKGGKAWMSKGKQAHSQNLRMPKHVLKLSSSDTVRVWWVPVLTRGKLHIEPLPDNFPGETEEGAAVMVTRVRAALNIRFQGGTAPKILFTDRGNGFYVSGTGRITPGYDAALKAHNLRAYFRDDASIQPGQLQEVMLHETAVSWMRLRLARTVPRRSWEETVEAYRSRLKDCAAYINANYNIDSLCRELPDRVAELRKREGGRLAK